MTLADVQEAPRLAGNWSDIFGSVFFQKFGHWNWHPELPRRLSGEPAAARFRRLDVDGLLVGDGVHVDVFGEAMCKIHRDNINYDTSV